MTDPNPSANLLDRLRAGDQEAAREVFARYAKQLSLLAEQHLSRKLAGRVDGEDVVQSVFRTFFRRCSESQFRIDTSGQLWRLLVQITLMKARAVGRRHTAASRDVGIEAGDKGHAWLEVAVSSDPSPEDAAALVDHIELLLRGLPSLYCNVLEMRLEGYSVAEVASKLGVSRQTVYRALELLQERLARDASAHNS